MSKSEEAKPDDGKIEKESDHPENPVAGQNLSLAASPPSATVAQDRERNKDEQVRSFFVLKELVVVENGVRSKLWGH